MCISENKKGESKPYLMIERNLIKVGFLLLWQNLHYASRQQLITDQNKNNLREARSFVVNSINYFSWQLIVYSIVSIELIVINKVNLLRKSILYVTCLFVGNLIYAIFLNYQSHATTNPLALEIASEYFWILTLTYRITNPTLWW